MDRLHIAIASTHPEPLLLATLEGAGHACTHFKTTAAVLAGLRRDAYDGVVMDLNQSCIAWQEVLERRKNVMSSRFFVLVFGSNAARALEAGADDFISTPIVADELLARVRRADRGRPPVSPTSRQPELPSCRLDLEQGCLLGRAGTIPLTSRELALAQLLFANAGQVLTRRRLARDVWCCDEDLVGHSIEQHVYQLRRKLARCAGSALRLRGVYGGGYRLEAQPDGGTSCLPE
jgi:DNA-binding response OmpR family regulator